MVTTGFSALASTSGYDAYKSALKNTKTIQNVAVQASAALQDNGNVLANANGNFKVSLDSKTASGTAKVSANRQNKRLASISKIIKPYLNQTLAMCTLLIKKWRRNTKTRKS